MKSLDEFAAGCREIAERCAHAGRARSSVHVAPFALEGQFRTAEARDEVGAAGADELIVWLMARDAVDLCEELKALAATLL